MIKKLSNGISYEFRECDMDMCYVSLIVWNGSLKDRGRNGKYIKCNSNYIRYI